MPSNTRMRFTHNFFENQVINLAFQIKQQKNCHTLKILEFSLGLFFQGLETYLQALKYYERVPQIIRGVTENDSKG